MRNNAGRLQAVALIGVLLRNLSSWRHFTNPWQVMQAWNFNEPICFDLAANKKNGRALTL
jgi:hypothetical protein